MKELDLDKEIVFAPSDPDVSHAIARLIKQEKLRKIAPRLYTTNLIDSPESIVRRNIMNILLDHMTLVPLVMAVLLAMLQDRHRPLWPWLMAQLPVVIFAVAGMDERNWIYGYELPHYWQLAVIAVFVIYYIFALRQYGHWLRDNYADLEGKEERQSLVFVIVLLAFYVIYASNAGELMRKYLSQVISIVIIAFLVWRVETLQELETK